MDEHVPLTEAELPLEPTEFERRLRTDIDSFIEEHDLGASRFEDRLSESGMREGLYTRVYNEIKAADVPRAMLEEAHRFDDPQVFVHLLKQIEDEAKHARLLAHRLWNLGGHPEQSLERAERSPIWTDLEDLSIVEQAATFQGAAERMAKARHPNELEYYDEETAEIYENVIVPEEQFHTMIGANILKKCTDEESQLEALRQVKEIQNALIVHNEGNAEMYAETEG